MIRPNFYPLKVVDRCSETQLQVGKVGASYFVLSCYFTFYHAIFVISLSMENKQINLCEKCVSVLI